ncbi:hypothetical protein CEXT_532481 [Caerostris extrusa]|uniref:Uncharacterized protein n=1 Tax=Caerostris extrusa TaxID=172846 RepID=A0AAV4SWY8_CAEEX|nr:hypothetical protein CEXT_532481 [Caerostris extrusa]
MNTNSDGVFQRDRFARQQSSCNTSLANMQLFNFGKAHKKCKRNWCVVKRSVGTHEVTYYFVNISEMITWRYIIKELIYVGVETMPHTVRAYL